MPTCSPARSNAGSPRDLTAVDSQILVVRHGAGRGPTIRFRSIRPDYCQPMFDDIARRWPEVHSRLSFWETGRPLPSLDRVTAVLFLLQDPLREAYPRCFDDSTKVAERARELGIKIINSPESLSNSIKSTQARLWRASGLSTPPSHRFNSIDELHGIAAQIAGPLILKSDTLHAQARTIVIDNLDLLRNTASELVAIPGSVSPVVDTRAGYQLIDPVSPYATHFHKKRAMVFGDHVCHNHVFFSTSPVVGCVSSSFGYFRSMNPVRRAIDGWRCQSHIQCDIDYHYADCNDRETLLAAARALDLGFCAIDYSVHADGRVELWEANPHFSLHRWPIGVLSRRRGLHKRTQRIHGVAADFLAELLEAAS